MPTAVEPYLLVESNLRHAMQFYAGTSQEGQYRKTPGVDLISCGRNYPIFNAALLSTPVPGEEGELSARTAMSSFYFRALDVGWSYWICHDLLDADSRYSMSETCATYRLEPVMTAPGLYAAKLKLPIHPAPAMDYREVTDATGRVAFSHLVSIIFDLPFAMTMNVYGAPEAWLPSYAGFIGYVAGQPVSIAMINQTGACCGFYSVGTLPGFRRLGYAESLMRHAYGVAQRRWSSECCVLQSSVAGRRLYEQMGFREVTRFSVYRSSSL